MAKGKGKRVMTEEPQQARKSRSSGKPRGGSSRVRIGEPRNAPDAEVLPHRFINQDAADKYAERYRNKKLLFEKPLIEGKVDPGFIQLLKDSGFKSLIGVPDIPLNDTVVREFFANLCEGHLRKGFVKVRGVKVKFTSNLINQKYGLPEHEVDSEDYRDELKKLVEEGRDPLEELRKEIHAPTPWTLRADNTRKEVPTTLWPEDWRVMCRFIHSRLRPKDNIGHYGIEDLGMLFALRHKLTINVGKTLYEEIVSHLDNKKRLMMVPYLIYQLCRDAGVVEDPSDHTIKNPPRGIKREKLRMQKLAARELGAESGVGPSRHARAPSESFFRPSERRQLSIAKSLQKWLCCIADRQSVIVNNQKLIADELKVKGIKDLEAHIFDFHPTLEDDISHAALSDSDDEMEAASVDQSAFGSVSGDGSGDASEEGSGEESVGDGRSGED